MKEKKTVIIIVAVLIVLIGGGLYAYFGMYNKSHRDYFNEEPAYELKSHELRDDFQEDQAAAQDKYLDKVLIVTGAIKKIEGDTNKTLILDGAACSLHKSETGEVNSGDQVKIKGRATAYDDMFGDVRLDNCFLIKSKP